MKIPHRFSLFSLVPIAGLAALSVAGCKKGETDDSGAALALLGVASTTVSEADVVANYVNNVVLPIYKNLSETGAALDTASQNLANAPSEANLIAAQNAWKAARIHWENSEAFLFGPVDQSGYDPRIDSWPLSKTDLDTAIGNNVTNVESEPDEIRGFHTVEYLIFDDGNGAGNQGWSTIGPVLNGSSARRNYLKGVTTDIKLVTGLLYSDWVNGYAAEMLGSITGTSSSYPTTKAALQQVATGMQIIVDEVASGKLNDPYAAGAVSGVELVESRYAWNSRDDFAENIRGVQIVWTGDYNGVSGPGLDQVVRQLNAELADRVTTQIQESIDAILAIPQPFRNNVTHPTVPAAIDKLNTLAETLNSEVIPLFSSL